MQTVKVKRDELLAKLKTNRDNHRDLFLKAQEKYRTAVIEELDAMLTEARDGKRIRRHVGLQAPVDQTPEYDRVIAMLEMSVDDTVTLMSNEFACYVLDKWAWAAATSMLNATYSMGGKVYENSDL